MKKRILTISLCLSAITSVFLLIRKKRAKRAAAAIAAFFVLFSVTAYAEPDYDYYVPTQPPPIVTVVEAPTIPNNVIGNPFMPDGAGTVINFATDEDGKMFYIIEAEDGHIFYLVIDRQRNMKNVYFLTAVTAADLVSLAGLPPSAIPTPPTTNAQPNGGAESDAETPDPAPQPNGGNNPIMFVIIGLLAIGGVAVGWYVKIYKPKQQGASNDDVDEYEPPNEDEVGIRDWCDEDYDATNEGVHPWYQEDESEVEQDEIY